MLDGRDSSKLDIDVNGDTGGAGTDSDLLSPAPRVRPRVLSPRERQIALLRRDGRTASEISSMIGIAQPSVERYFESIGTKTGTHNAAQLIKWLSNEHNRYVNTYCRCGSPIPLGKDKCQPCLDREAAMLVPLNVQQGVAELYVLARKIADMDVDQWLGKFAEDTGDATDTTIRVRKLLTAALELKRVVEEL